MDGFETVFGTDGPDIISGNDVENILFGGLGDDQLLGASDQLDGGDGNDQIDGTQFNLTPGLMGVRYRGYFNDNFDFFKNAPVIEDSRFPITSPRSADQLLAPITIIIIQLNGTVCLLRLFPAPISSLHRVMMQAGFGLVTLGPQLMIS